MNDLGIHRLFAGLLGKRTSMYPTLPCGPPPQSPDSFPRVQMPRPQGSSCRCTALTGTRKNRSASTSDTGQVSVVLETIGLSSVMVPLAEPAGPEMVAPDAEISVTVKVTSFSSVESLAVAMRKGRRRAAVGIVSVVALASVKSAPPGVDVLRVAVSFDGAEVEKFVVASLVDVWRRVTVNAGADPSVADVVAMLSVLDDGLRRRIRVTGERDPWCCPCRR